MAVTKDMFQARSWQDIQKFHRMGFDQTENIARFFCNELKVIKLAHIDLHKERVQDGAFYLSRLDDDYLVIDMFAGLVYKVYTKDYDVYVEDDNIIAVDLNTYEETVLVVNSSLVWGSVKYLGESNYIYHSSDSRKGFKGYPALRLKNERKESLRIHWIIPLMDYDIEALEGCVGYFHINEIHHKKPIGSGGTNSIENLVIMKKSSHEMLHGYYKRER